MCSNPLFVLSGYTLPALATPDTADCKWYDLNDLLVASSRCQFTSFYSLSLSPFPRRFGEPFFFWFVGFMLIKLSLYAISTHSLCLAVESHCSIGNSSCISCHWKSLATFTFPCMFYSLVQLSVVVGYLCWVWAFLLPSSFSCFNYIRIQLELYVEPPPWSGFDCWGLVSVDVNRLLCTTYHSHKRHNCSFRTA